MKCVGAEDGQRQCQRCKRANVECVLYPYTRLFILLSNLGASLKNIVEAASRARSLFA